MIDGFQDKFITSVIIVPLAAGLIQLIRHRCWCATNVNRQGSTRVVFLIGSLAIKTPNFLDDFNLFIEGLSANRVEAQLSKTRNSLLCPVRFCFPMGLFLIMSRAKVLEREDADRYDLDKLFPSFRDCKFNNFGWLNGKIVMLDYGLGKDKTKPL